MAIYNLECCCCGHSFKKLASKIPDDVPCPMCTESPVRWAGTGPTSRVVEVRDNGLMPKKVEQLAGIDEIVLERSTKGPDDGTIV